MNYEIKEVTDPKVLETFAEDKAPEVPMISYIRLADHVAAVMQKGLLDGQEFYGLYEAMEEVDPYWRTR